MSDPRLSLRWYRPVTFSGAEKRPLLLQEAVRDSYGGIEWVTIPTVLEDDGTAE